MCDIQVNYEIDGMTCTSCATKVSSAVAAVAGVTGTNTDVVNGVLTVSGHVDDAEVRAAITGAGYAVAG